MCSLNVGALHPCVIPLSAITSFLAAFLLLRASRRRIVSADFSCHLTEPFSFEMGVRMRKYQISINALRLIFLCLPIYSFADEIRKIDFAEYRNTVVARNSACGSKGMPSFSGFCLSQEYGKAAFNNPTQTSITVGLEIASFEYFYSNCEHSDFSSVSEALAKTKRLLDAAKYFEEIKVQKEALDNYVGRFYFCRTKSENDATILNRLKWFEYMAGRYSAGTAGGNGSVSNIVPSNKSTEYAAGVGNERLSLICDGSGMIDTACFIGVGSSGSVQAVRFITQSTRYSHLLLKGVEKALAPEQHLRRLRASDIPILRELALDQCHPAAESKGVSGDLLQLCMPADSSRVVLFIRGLCDRCDFEPVVLEKQVPQ